MVGRTEPHFSFAGLKTAVRHAAEALVPLQSKDIADLCADFEAAVAASVSNRVARAMTLAEERLGDRAPRRLVVAGGVAANTTLRAALTSLATKHGYAIDIPPVALCGDNAAMIAWAGAERLARGWTDGDGFTARARWPLDEAATPVLGHGRLGTKA
jgi:N6-L-threonylcarbamoyladenine synthase